jgi:CheY-like chemotaxis protein
MSGSVLIIDADPLFAAQAQASFEGAGLVVAVRDDASLDTIRKLRPSVLLVSAELPKGSGFSVCNRLRRDKELQLIPILLTSSAADGGEAFRRHATTPERADDYAPKPVEQAELLARVKRLLALADERNVPSGALEAGMAEVSVAGASLPPPPPPSSAGGPPPLGAGARPAGPAGAPPPIPRPPPIPGRPPPIPGGTTQSGAVPLSAAAFAGGGIPVAPSHVAPLPGRDGTGMAPALGRAPAPALAQDLGAPPPARPSLAPGGEDGWRAATFDDMLRERLNVPAPAALPKMASTDQREAFLRSYGKFLEAKEKAAREGWEVTQEAAKELDRRYQHTRFELAQREGRLAELGAELEQTRLNLHAVQTELGTFQGEITRIFQDKDSEERETQARLSELEEANSALSRDLQEARKQNDDDRTRLKLFKSELDDFQTESERLNAALQAANDRGTRLDDSLKQAERQIKALEARIEASDAVIAEKNAELEDSKERLDRLAIDAQNEQRRLIEEHAEALAAREAALSQEIAALETTELELRNEVEGLTAERASLEHQLAQRTEEKLHLERVKSELTSALDEAEAMAIAERERLEAAIAELELEKAGQGSIIAELSDARDELDRKLRETQDELLKETATFTTREAELNEEVEDRERELIQLEKDLAAERARLAELEKELASTRAALTDEQATTHERAAHHETQLVELEAEQEELRSTLFERLAELDAQRSNVTNLVEQLEAARAESAQEKSRAAAIDAALRKAEASLDDKRRELAELSQRLLDTEASLQAAEQGEHDTQVLLGETEKKLERADNFVLRAKEKIVELQKRHDEATADVRRDGEAQLAREREARREVEEQLTQVEQELSRRELEAAEATRHAQELAQRITELERQHTLALEAKGGETTELERQHTRELEAMAARHALALEAQAKQHALALEAKDTDTAELERLYMLELEAKDTAAADAARKHALALAAKEADVADRSAELEDLRKQAFEAQAQVESQEGRILALIGDVETRERTAQGLRAELSHKEQKLSAQGVDLVKLRDQLRANAELSRERERRDVLLGRLMSTLDEVQAALSTSPHSLGGRRSVPPGEDEAHDPLAGLVQTHDVPTRQLAAGWPQPATGSGAASPAPSGRAAFVAPGDSPASATSTAGRSTSAASGNTTGAYARTAARSAGLPTPPPTSTPASTSGSLRLDDETTSEADLAPPMPSMRSPFPPPTSPPPPLVPKAPAKPDALTPASTTGLFGALINEMHSESAAPKPSTSSGVHSSGVTPPAGGAKPARRVSIEPPRSESTKGTKRRARVPEPRAETKPRTGGSTLAQLDEVAMLVDSSLIDVTAGQKDPFRTGGAALPTPQAPEVLLEDLERADLAFGDDAEELEEGQVTEIIRLDQLK